MHKLIWQSVRIYFEILSRIIFGILHWGSKAKPLDPPIKNKLLLEPATSLAEKIRTKQVTSEEVVRAFMTRIEEVNQTLNAVVDRCFEEAIDAAKKVDELIKSGDKTEEELAKSKPFLGVPFTIKDCVAVKGLKQTAGLYARKDFVPEKDGEVVRLMKEAGAIMIAVTNVPEVCMWWEANNMIYGQTNNPYDITRIPGGSSGGEGVNLSAGGSPMGIGSDLGGSVRIPAFFNGIFGHKPSAWIVDDTGHEPIWTGKHTEFQTVGPMSRFAVDLLPMYKIMASSNVKQLSLDKKVDISKLKVYYMEDFGTNDVRMSPVDEELIDAHHKVLNHFKETFAIEPQKLKLPKFQHVIPMWFAMMESEKNGTPFELVLGNKKKEINVYLELVKSLFRISKHTFIALLFAIIARFRWTDEDENLIKMCQELKQELKDILGDDGVLIYPTHPTIAYHHYQTYFRFFNFGTTSIFNVLGMPGTHCPLGLNKDGLPLGLQVVASHSEDRLCLAAAVELEKAFGGWVCPSKIDV